MDHPGLIISYKTGEVLATKIHAKHLNGDIVEYWDWQRKSSRSPGPDPQTVRKSQGSYRRDIANACIAMRNNQEHACRVFVLTCPDNINDSDCDNRPVSKYFNWLRKCHGVNNYLWVREKQPKSGRPHWHCISDCPRINYQDHNRVWCNNWNNFSKNAWRKPPLKKNEILHDPYHAANYLGKYLSKHFDGSADHIGNRKIGISNKLKALAAPQIFEVDPPDLSNYRSFYTEKGIGIHTIKKNLFRKKID